MRLPFINNLNDEVVVSRRLNRGEYTAADGFNSGRELQRHDTHKLHSVHAPEVECIAKGKAHEPYEFGCKVVVVTTAKTNWVIAIDAVHKNPYDGATLSPAIKHGSERLRATRV
jgi:IS5 family transposase